MAHNLVPCDREQGYLMLPSLQEWLPEGDLAWFILDVVGQMDLKEFYAAYREDGWGAAAYDPGFRTLCRFRAERQEALKRLFVQVLKLCREAGMVNGPSLPVGAGRGHHPGAAAHLGVGPRSYNEPWLDTTSPFGEALYYITVAYARLELGNTAGEGQGRNGPGTASGQENRPSQHPGPEGLVY